METTKQPTEKSNRSSLKFWSQITMIVTGLVALIWFLIRVIPKPSRATYPCQRAAFPIATAFVIWLTGTLGSMFLMKQLKAKFAKNSLVLGALTLISVIVLVSWFTVIPAGIAESFGSAAVDTTFVPGVGYNWKPGASNQPVGIARGIIPGRVVMVRNPLATKWAGNWKKNEDQWWSSKCSTTCR